MYIARLHIFGPRRYALRRSVRRQGGWESETLAELGPDPGSLLRYPGGNAVYVDQEFVERVQARHGALDEAELDELFWPWVRPEIRRAVGPFRSRRRSPRRKPRAGGSLHPFDKRRLFFLRCGRFDAACPADSRLFRVLTAKSRDEIEQHLLGMEDELHARERKLYVTAIFDLPAHFPDWMFARAFPQTLDPERLADAFIEELCRLDQDTAFWRGFPRTATLPEYLARYVVMFFDSRFPSFSADEEFIRRFTRSRRRFAWPERRSPVATDAELEHLFGVPADKLRRMSGRELTRLYRQRAKDLHPDTGGEHEVFIRLTAAYEHLLSKDRR